MYLQVGTPRSRYRKLSMYMIEGYMKQCKNDALYTQNNDYAFLHDAVLILKVPNLLNTIFLYKSCLGVGELFSTDF